MLLDSCCGVDCGYAHKTVAVERIRIVVSCYRLLAHHRAAENLVCVADIAGTLHSAKHSEKRARTQIHLT